jgi:hypothetical protein
MTKQPVIRTIYRTMAPVGVKCVICKLMAEEDGGVVNIKIRYDGNERNSPLSALTRYKYICEDCVTTIGEAVSKE